MSGDNISKATQNEERSSWERRIAEQPFLEAIRAKGNPQRLEIARSLKSCSNSFRCLRFCKVNQERSGYSWTEGPSWSIVRRALALAMIFSFSDKSWTQHMTSHLRYCRSASRAQSMVSSVQFNSMGRWLFQQVVEYGF